MAGDFGGDGPRFFGAMFVIVQFVVPSLEKVLEYVQLLNA